MATTTKMATTAKPSRGVKTLAAHQRGIPAARLVTVVEWTSELSDEVLTTVEEGQRAAIEAAGRFLVTVEEALPQEVEGAFEVVKKIAVSGLEMADQLVQTQYDVLRQGHRQHCQVGQQPQRSRAKRRQVGVIDHTTAGVSGAHWPQWPAVLAGRGSPSAVHAGARDTG